MPSRALQASFSEDLEQRAADRRILKLEARAATPVGRGGVNVHNLSPTGLMIEGKARLEAGHEIEVELPGGTTHRARVIWAEDGLAGCRFARPLSKAQLSAALLRSEPREAVVLSPAKAAPPIAAAEQLQPGQPLSEERLLPLPTRMRIIAALALAAWAVPAATAWLLL